MLNKNSRDDTLNPALRASLSPSVKYFGLMTPHFKPGLTHLPVFKPDLRCCSQMPKKLTPNCKHIYEIKHRQSF